MSKSDESDQVPIDIDRTDEILRFVRQNPNCTKADVIRYMKGRSSTTTTHFILLNLINEGKIDVFKKNVQTHFLTLNENDEFIKFHKMLVDLEKLVDDMYTFLSFKVDQSGLKIEDLYKPECDAHFYEVHRNSKIKKLFVGLEGIENSYRQSFSLITQLLSREILSRGASFQNFQSIVYHILHRIGRRLSHYNWDIKTSNELLAVSAKNIEESFKVYNSQVKIKTDMGKRLIDTIEGFKKEILNRRFIDIVDLPYAQKKKILDSIKASEKEIIRREKGKKKLDVQKQI